MRCAAVCRQPSGEQVPDMETHCDASQQVTEQYLAAGEKLFGPYHWEVYDLLVMPPCFAYGGMENPRLTFVTPCLLAGDKSLGDVVAHEIAHSWYSVCSSSSSSSSPSCPSCPLYRPPHSPLLLLHQVW